MNSQGIEWRHWKDRDGPFQMLWKLVFCIFMTTITDNIFCDILFVFI